MWLTGGQVGDGRLVSNGTDLLLSYSRRDLDGSGWGVFGRRYSAALEPRSAEFRLNSYTTGHQAFEDVSSDEVGNFVVTWISDGQDGSALASDGNGVLEVGEYVAVRPWWRNVNGATQTFDGICLGFTGPPAPGANYLLVDGTGAYGTVPNGAVHLCSDCYAVGLLAEARPSSHWDATITERLTPDVHGQTKPWSIHVGESFADVPRASPYYRFVETLLHEGVTGGCSAASYCPTSAVTREQMSVFVLTGKEGSGYLPTACGTPVFGDVPASSPYCRYIEELVRRGVVSGCGGGNYCPGSPVTREQVAVFITATFGLTLYGP